MSPVVEMEAAVDGGRRRGPSGTVTGGRPKNDRFFRGARMLPLTCNRCRSSAIHLRGAGVQGEHDLGHVLDAAPDESRSRTCTAMHLDGPRTWVRYGRSLPLDTTYQAKLAL